MGSLRYSSIERSRETLSTLANLGLRRDRVLVITGSVDPLVIPAELKTDAVAALGVEKLEWKVIRGAMSS